VSTRPARCSTTTSVVGPPSGSWRGERPGGRPRRRPGVPPGPGDRRDCPLLKPRPACYHEHSDPTAPRRKEMPDDCCC
jgi:hypothetical protein